MKKMVEAVEVVHSKGIVHLDIKPLNFVVKDEGPNHCKSIRLIDFGGSKKWKKRDGPLKTSFGTYKYKSPEQKEDDKRPDKDKLGIDGFKADIYSLGLTFWEMVCGYGT